MAQLTYQQLIGAVAVILVLLGAYNTVMGAIKAHREEKKFRESPVTKLTERVDRHDELLAKDKDRLDKLETDVMDLGEATRILLRQSMAANDHMISGNDVSKLRESNTEIQKYLLNRK